MIPYSFTPPSGLRVQPFIWQVTIQNLEQQCKAAYLMDNYLKRSYPLNLNGKTNIPFSVTSDAPSYATGRFYIAMVAAGQRLTNSSDSVQEEIKSDALTFRINPNPVPNHNLNVTFDDARPGSYKAGIISASGQMISLTPFILTSEDTFKRLSLPNSISKGYYSLQITDTFGNTHTEPLIIQ